MTIFHSDIRYLCTQDESNVLYGDGDPIDTKVPFRFIKDVPVGDVVIEQWDRGTHRGESRWIVRASALTPWDNQQYVKLAQKLGISEADGKDLMQRIHLYNCSVRQLDTDSTKLLAKIQSFNKEAFLKEMAFIIDLLIAGSPLEKMLNERLGELSDNLVSLSEREGLDAVSSLIQNQKGE